MVDNHYTQQLHQFIKRYYFEIIHAFKAAIAMMIAYSIYLATLGKGLMAQWMLVTIIIVMSSHSALGPQVGRALFRVWATLIGAVLAILALMTPYKSVTIPIYLFITTMVFIFGAVSYGRYGMMGTMGAATFCMIVLNTHPSVKLASARTLEVLLGIVISLLVSRFIFPIRSVRLIKQRCFINLSRIAELYHETLISDKRRFTDPMVIKLENKIINSHQIQRELQAHLKYENKKNRRYAENIKLIIRSQIALYRYFSVLEVTKRILTEENNNDQQSITQLKNFVVTVVDFIHSFVDNYPSASPKCQYVMRQQSQELVEYVNRQKFNHQGLSALHTLCFISQRVIKVCELLVRHG